MTNSKKRSRKVRTTQLDRFKRNDMRKEEQKIEGYLKAIQNVGELTGEVLKEDEDKDRCKVYPFLPA
jgi:hypothetical protein